MTRMIAEIEPDLAEARRIYAYTGPTHASVERCERLYAELQAAKRKGGG